MPRTRECDYCGGDIEPGTGTMLIRNDGSTVDFCSSKCENNADLGREARNLEWTETGGGGEQAADETESEEAEADADEPASATDEAAESEADESGDEEAEEAEA